MDLLLAVLAGPDADEVVAGGWGAVILLGLFGAAIVLAFSFRKQMRKAQAAKDAGVFGDEPVAPEDDEQA